jgi:hypothetical protein
LSTRTSNPTACETLASRLSTEAERKVDKAIRTLLLVSNSTDVSKMIIFNYLPRKEDLLAQRHPLSAVGDTFPVFWRVVLAPPVLRARANSGGVHGRRPAQPDFRCAGTGAGLGVRRGEKHVAQLTDDGRLTRCRYLAEH